VTRETNNQLSIVVLKHDRGLYVVFHRSGLSFCETVQQE